MEDEEKQLEIRRKLVELWYNEALLAILKRLRSCIDIDIRYLLSLTNLPITEVKWLANTVSNFKSQIKFCRKTCFLWLPEISFSNFPSWIDNPTFESVIQERYRITQRGIIQSNCFVDTEGDIGDGLLVACWGRKSISVLRSLWKTTPAGTQECWLRFRWST